VSRDALHGPQGTHVELERLMFFSDAVYAIAITLLVLEIRVPAREAVHSGAELLHALAALTPRFFAFFLSFVVVGFYWFTHHVMFRYVRRWDDTLIVLNLALLLCVAFLPFPVSLLGEFPHQAAAVAVYTGAMAVTGLVQTVLWTHIVLGRRLTDPDLPRPAVALVYMRVAVPPVMFAVSMLLTATLGPTAALWSLALVLPVRLLRHRLTAAAHASAPAPGRSGRR